MAKNKEENWDEGTTVSQLQEKADACIHCGKCQKVCAFLSKYQMDLGDVSRLQEHLWSCFLCGKCSQVCPAGIRGEELFKGLRRMEVRDGNCDMKAYSFVLKEKRDYKFRNYRNATEGSVLFPGCNFPSLFPKTNRYLEKIFQEKGIGTVYDCCGKPIAELGLYKDEERILQRITTELDARGIEEIITMCPNCYYFLRDRIPQRVVSVYEKLESLQIPLHPVPETEMHIPCPDGESREWVGRITSLLGYEPAVMNRAQCCGLGGMAAAREPELAKSFAQSTPRDTQGSTFCASCAGQFARNGQPISHILSQMLGIDEKPAAKTSYINRVLTKFK